MAVYTFEFGTENGTQEFVLAEDFYKINRLNELRGEALDIAGANIEYALSLIPDENSSGLASPEMMARLKRLREITDEIHNIEWSF